MIERTDDFAILPGAYRAWESFSMPGRIDEVVDAVFGLPDDAVRYYRVVPSKDLWCVEGMVRGWLVKIFGVRAADGRWSSVREVHPHGRG